MLSLHRVGNHIKYIRSNFAIVASSFILMLASMLVVGSLARAGENALACAGNYDSCGYQSNDGNGYYGQQGGYPVTAGYDNGCNSGCQQQAPKPSPCPWWNSSYNCPHPPPTQTPCPWWNNSYACARHETPRAQPCQYGCQQQQPPQQQPCQNSPCNGGGGGYPDGGTAGYPGGGGGYPDNGPDYPPADNDNDCDNGMTTPCSDGGMPPEQQPTPTPTPTPSETPQAPVNNNNNVNNNNSSAVANVVVNPAAVRKVSTVVSRPAPAASSAIVLPETGPADGLLNIAGAGGLVASGTAYVASRRELLRSVFKR